MKADRPLRTRRALIARCLVCVCATVLPGASALGQEIPERAGTTRGADTSAFTARAIVRSALIDLRLRQRPEARDFELASLMLGLAQELCPADEELVRWQVSLADAGEDNEALDRHLCRLLELSGRDTFAQFRLISARLRREQSVEKRLAMYEQALGTSGARLDASIRSRLAFEGAALLKERGDEGGYVARLKLAASLDPTNKEAATEALTYFSDKTADQMGRLELVANLLNADPTDPMTHMEMSRELFAGGDFESARRFQNNALSVFTRAGIDRGTVGMLEELAVDWPADGPSKVVERLNKALDVRRDEVKQRIRQLQEDLQSTANIPKPEDIRLDPSLDRMRLLAATTCGDKVTADNAMADLSKWYDQAFVQLQGGVPEAAKDIDPVAATRSLHFELATLLFWTGQAPELAAQNLEAGASEAGTDPKDPELLEARGWSVARTDRAAEAISILTPLARDRAISGLGLGAACEQLGQRAEAVAHYGQVIRDQPMTVEACWALGRVKELTGVQTPDRALTKKMKAFAGNVPSLFDDMIKEPRRVMSLDAELIQTTLQGTEPAVLRVTLTNVTTFPLGVGPERTIDSRVLVNPGLEEGPGALRNGTTPEILDLERRIRLMPRESLEVTFWADPGLTGWLIETNCDKTVRVLWRLLQGFVRGKEGTVDSGATCLTASTRSQVRSPLVEASFSPAELGKRLEAATDAELPALVLAARSRLLAQGAAIAGTKPPVSDLSAPVPIDSDRPTLKEEDRDAIAQGAARRYEKARPAVRLLLLASLPHARQVPAMKVLDDLARAEQDPGVMCLVLVTRVSDPKDELLERAKGSADSRVSAVARLMEERLGAGAPSYGALGPGLTGLVRPRPEAGK